MNDPVRNLAKLFQSCRLEVFSSNFELYRGCWQKNNEFIGGMWFADSLDSAANYVASNLDHGKERGLIPIIFKARPRNQIILANLRGSHIKIFEEVYNGCWQHDWLVRDIPLALNSLEKGEIDGFYRLTGPEFFIPSVEESLELMNIISGQQALFEAERMLRQNSQYYCVPN